MHNVTPLIGLLVTAGLVAETGALELRHPQSLDGTYEEQEPNNGDPNPVPDSATTVTGVISGVTDSDWFRVTAPPAWSVYVEEDTPYPSPYGLYRSVECDEVSSAGQECVVQVYYLEHPPGGPSFVAVQYSFAVQRSLVVDPDVAAQHLLEGGALTGAEERLIDFNGDGAFDVGDLRALYENAGELPETPDALEASP